MESDCRISVIGLPPPSPLCAGLACLPRSLALYSLLWSLVSVRVLGVPVSSEMKTPVMSAMATPCWQVEEFVVARECSQCNAFQSSWAACTQTGYVEMINCAKSNKDEYKSCRSALMEESRFWRFEGTVVGLTVVFALLVVMRQRALDRLASEKVRKQIESI
ncbi:protein JTB isoform X2 [Amia ocellicauda]|uniref:protein JTB isoform X2 n=1 Tax=Amia ocellicauda TaxID=2972642 RepID=UPI0034646661